MSGRRKGPIEIYADGRYFTMTGDHLPGTPTTIEERSLELAAVCGRVFDRPDKQPHGHGRGPRPAPVDDDQERLERAFAARNGQQVRALFEGDCSAHSSPSEADLALVNHLAFWFDRDPARMDLVFRRSGLMRDKWDERRGTQTYGAITIEKAIAGCQTSYSAENRPARRPSARSETTAHATSTPTATGAPEDSPVPVAFVMPPESFVTRYTAYAIQRTDAPALAHELMAVIMLSALVGPQTRVPIATTVKGWSLVLWGMYIVNSTTGRKTVVINTAADILEQVLGQDALIPWEGSPQGLIQRLQKRDHQAAVFTRDEYSGLLKQMNRARHLAGLEQNLIRAYDGGRLENIRTRKYSAEEGDWVEDTDVVEEPYLVKLTAATFDSFTMAATIDNVLNGLLARFIFVTGTATPRPLRLSSSQLEADRAAVLAHARAFQSRAHRVAMLPVDQEVLAAAWTLEVEWQRLAGQSTRPDAAGPALKRLADSVLKVACLLALDDAHQDPPVVRMSHLLLARQMGDRWLMSTNQLIEALGRSEFAKDSEAVLATIRRHAAGVPLSALYRAHRNLRQRDFNEILDALTTQDQIERLEVKTGGPGRPSRIIKVRK